MIGIVIISHSGLASGLLEAAMMIYKDIKQVIPLSISDNTNMKDFTNELDEAVKAVSNNSPVLILSDLLGGSPCNAAINLLAHHHESIEILTGVNLPMLLCALSTRKRIADMQTLISIIVEDAKTSIVNVNELIEKENL